MHLPHLNAHDVYVQPVGTARKDKLKSAEFEPFVIESALEKPEGGRNFAAARREPESGLEQQASSFDENFAVAYAPPAPAPEGEAALPEDALDGQELCALLEAAAKG
jgi:hypothetical protein